MRIEINKLVDRLSGAPSGNRVAYFQDGRVVRKPFQTVCADLLEVRKTLLAWGVGANMRVGMRASNCYEWMLFDVALNDLGAVTVAFTDDFASTSAEELCETYSLSLILVSQAELSQAGGHSNYVAAMDARDEPSPLAVKARIAGDNSEIPYCLIFSSGSSGGLKGLSLNRQGVEASIDALVEAVKPRRNDALLLFLPMSNYQQRMMCYAALWYGFDLILADPARLFRALKELRPTILIGPPALYEALENRVGGLPVWKRSLISRVAAVIRRLPVQRVRCLAARAAFRQIHAALGGRMRFMITGMAPIKRSTLLLFESLQLPLCETYGLMEFGSVSLNLPGAYKLGSVGRPLPGVTVEIADDGEIVVHREPTVARGYFECAAGEAERTFIGQDRVRTGDIGRLDSDGYLYLTGRRKEIIVMANGEKVHPEVVEAELDDCPGVLRSVVFQPEDCPGLAAVIALSAPEDENARKHINNFIEQRNLRRRSSSVNKIIFTEVAFTRENGFLRPNLKLDRNAIARHFSARAMAATQL